MKPLPVAACPPSARTALFRAGDCAYLMTVSAAATVTMHLAHRLGWGFVPKCAAGMAAAMIVQTLVSLVVTPLLGSIESMVPGMVVAMLSPMAVCAFHMAGYKPGHGVCVGLGALLGAVMFGYVAWYAGACRRSGAARLVQGIPS